MHVTFLIVKFIANPIYPWIISSCMTQRGRERLQHRRFCKRKVNLPPLFIYRLKIKLSSKWSNYVFLFSVSITEYLDMQCCFSHRKYNSNSEKIITVIWLHSRKYQRAAARIHLTLRLFHMLRKFIKLVTSSTLSAVLLTPFEKLCKKIASTFRTWLPLSDCQTISCALFISFNAIDLMQCNSSYFWSTCHVQYNTLAFFLPPFFFYVSERIKSTISVFKKRALWMSHLKTLLLRHNPRFLFSG